MNNKNKDQYKKVGGHIDYFVGDKPIGLGACDDWKKLMGKPRKNCRKCKGRGTYCVGSRKKLCELCCCHPWGFTVDKEGFHISSDYEYCEFGCGMKRRKKSA